MKLLLAAALAALSAWAQKPGAVEGVVTNSATGAPVKKALVTLRDQGERKGYQAISDSAGRFRIDGVKPGNYGLWGEAQGYVRDLDRFSAPSQAVKVAEDQTVRDLAIRLEPLGAISGRVLDENGEPIPGAALDAMRYTYSGHGPSLIRGAVTTTDDRGEFRVFDLEPGRWYLRANKSVIYPKAAGRVHRAMPDMDYRETFYPGVNLAGEASPIVLSPGADLGQIEFRLRKQRTFRVRGKAVEAGGAPAAGAHVTIEGQGYVEVHPDGTFDARAIPAGSHRISASLTRNELALVAAWQEITVADRDADNLVLRLDPLGSLAGTVVVEGPGKLNKARVTLEPLGGLAEMERATVAEDGRFLVPRVAPQAYGFAVDNLPAGMYLKSARFGDQDASETGRIDLAAGGASLSLVLASDSGRITGTVSPLSPAGGTVIVTLAPVGRLAARTDLIRSVDVDDGRFELKSAVPGDYHVWAWELHDEGLAASPEFRKVLAARATAVTVHPGETQSLPLTPIPAAEIAEAREKLR